MRAVSSLARADREREASVNRTSTRAVSGSASLAVSAVLLAIAIWTSAGAQQETQQPQTPQAQQAQQQDRDSRRRQRFTHDGLLRDERGAERDRNGKKEEAPTGFDNQTNGFDPQGPDFDSLEED